MKNLSIILACLLAAMMSCTKSKEVHPEIGDGNDEIVTVGINDVHVKYARTDHAELNRVVFHYCPADANGNAQQFETAEMIKRETLFELTLNDLLSDTLYWYYYESFSSGGDASNSSQKTFRTQAFDQPEPPTPPTPPSGAPEGAINGLFTINENGDQVYFSQGNLQYIGSAATPYWKFADNQWDYLGNGQGSTFQNVDRDLFGWGTSGWNNGNRYYQPYDTESSLDSESGYGYGPTDGMNYEYGLTYDYANADWGVYNAISNGGNIPGIWRTLTWEQWHHVFNYRTTSSGICYAKGIVNGVNGVILLPDEWDPSVYALNYPNRPDARYNTNEIALENWATMEANGAVFLAAAGFRDGTSVSFVGNEGSYWSASYLYSNGAYDVNIFDSDLMTGNGNSRFTGRSVRLVAPAE